MTQKNFSKYAKYKNNIQLAIYALKENQGIIIIDDKNRENEGDLVFYPESMTISQMALTIRHGSGIICLCIMENKRKKLNLPMMVKNNTSIYKTGFTVSIESSQGISTGVSAQDRLQTIKTVVSNQAKPSDLNKPGHIFPLCAHPKGILYRPGHTEASITLMILSGLKPISVICELTNKDGSMSKKNDIKQFAKTYNMPIISIHDLTLYLR